MFKKLRDRKQLLKDSHALEKIRQAIINKNKEIQLKQKQINQVTFAKSSILPVNPNTGEFIDDTRERKEEISSE